MSAGSAYGAMSSSGQGGGFSSGYTGYSTYGGAASGMPETMRGTGTMPGGMMGGYDAMGPSSSTVLTIRAKKADVDAFAGNMMMPGDFQQKVKIVMY